MLSHAICEQVVPQRMYCCGIPVTSIHMLCTCTYMHISLTITVMAIVPVPIQKHGEAVASMELEESAGVRGIQ